MDPPLPAAPSQGEATWPYYPDLEPACANRLPSLNDWIG